MSAKATVKPSVVAFADPMLRADIECARALLQHLLSEAEALITPHAQDLIGRLVEELHPPQKGESEGAARRRTQRTGKMLAKLKELPQRSDLCKRLIERLNRMEREAFGTGVETGQLHNPIQET